MSAVFELVNRQTDGVLRPGTSRIAAVSAWATHGPLPGRTEGLEILFFTAPITEADRSDIVDHDAKQLKKKDFASLVLVLDKENTIRQVNLGMVVPGTTVVRTVAWKAEDLASFSNYQFDGKRLRLRSRGTLSELNAKQESLSLSWDVDIDMPVHERKGE